MDTHYINYNNDVYFKFLLSLKDDEKELLRKYIISDTFNAGCIEREVPTSKR